MVLMTAIHMECCTDQSDKYYRYFADTSARRLHTTYGARGQRGRSGPTLWGDSVAHLRTEERTRASRGYRTVAELRISVAAATPTAHDPPAA